MKATWKTMLWITCLLLIFGCGTRRVFEIGLRGEGYVWEISYPGEDGKLGTGDDRKKTGDIGVPAQTKIVLHITSGDYIYEFNLSSLQLSQMAVPDLVFPLEFTSGSPRRIPFLGDQMCGFSHSTLNGDVLVLESEAFETWLKEEQPQQESR